MRDDPRFGVDEWRLAYSVALKVLQAPDLAEDAAQEALIKAFRAIDTFEGRSRFESWLYRIAYTTALSELRRPHHRLRRSAVNDQVELAAEPTAEPDVIASTAELAGCMKGCLDDMRELDRVAFTERFLHGRSERELGELLGVSTNAAKQRAFRARRALRACVESQRDDAD